MTTTKASAALDRTSREDEGRIRQRSPDAALITAVLRTRWRGAVAEGLLAGIVVCTSAFGYASTYRQPAERLGLQATLGDNTGMAALFGRPHTLATLGGFVAWRSLGFLMVVGAIWGALLGARLFRGEEEDGRLEAVLAGRTTRRRTATMTLAAAAGLLALSWLATALGALLGSTAGAGWSAGATVLLSSVLLAPAALFVAVGAVTSQLCRTRRSAALGAGAVFAVLFVGRMCVGALAGWQWLGDVDPLVWLDRSAPFVGSHLGWLLAVVGVAAACAVAAVLLAGRRDVGGILPERAERPPRRGRPVDSAERLAVYTVAGASLGWWASLAAASAVMGLLAKPVAEASGQSADMRRVFAQLTHTAVSGARVFVGLAMVMLSLVVCLSAAAATAALRDEEATGRLEVLLAMPLSRRRWLAGRLCAAGGALVIGGLLVGLCLWASSAPAHAGLGLASLLGAGLNLVPAAVVVLAVGALTLAVRPRWTAAATYALLAYSFVVELVGALVHAPRWLLDTSLLHHVALAPATSPDLRTDAVLLALAAAIFLVAGRQFGRRDLIGA